MKTKFKPFLTLIFVLTYAFVPAQVNTKQNAVNSDDCSCSQALEEVIDKVTRVYAGFDDKVTAKTRPGYEKLVRNLRSKASAASSPLACQALLQTYTGFFKDSHVSSVWMKGTKQAVSNMEANKNRTDLVIFKKLNDDFLYVKLAVFDQREVGKLDSMLLANRELLSQTPYLIMDLRGNGGGNTSTSDEMARLIYTNPMVYPAWDYRSSDEFIRSKERELKAYKDTTDPYYKRVLNLINAAKANPGKMVKDSDDLVRTLDVNPQSYPGQIAFLIDKGSGSATEFYIFEGKQSKKVTIFGTNSYGVMDYGSDQDFRICDGVYNLATPWGRNGWVKDFRIDNVGFKPDVRIPEGEKDWIGFVQKYYAKANTVNK